MSLDLTTLKRGDIVDYDEASGMTTEWPLRVEGVGPDFVVARGRDNSLHLLQGEALAVMSRVTRSTPSPVSAPIVFRHAADGRFVQVVAPGEVLPRPTRQSLLTVHPFVAGDIDDTGRFLKARWT